MTSSNEHEFYDQLGAATEAPQTAPTPAETSAAPEPEYGQHSAPEQRSGWINAIETGQVPTRQEPRAEFGPHTGPVPGQGQHHATPPGAGYSGAGNVPAQPGHQQGLDGLGLPGWNGQPQPQQQYVPVPPSFGNDPYAPTPHMQPVAPPAGWGRAPGASAPVTQGGQGLRDDLKASDMVRNRTIPSSRGWRKWLYQASFHSINVGESPDEIEVRQLLNTIKTPLVGTHTIAVVGGKGGAGKTTTTAALATTFAAIRKKDPVVATDADSAQAANLPDRIAPGSSASFSDVVAGKQLRRNADVRNYMGQNIESGLDVLAGPERSGGGGDLDSQTYEQALDLMELYYNLLFTDTGVAFKHPVMPAVFARANTVVLVASSSVSELGGTWVALNWLENAGYDAQRTRMVVVINHPRPFDNRRDRKETEKRVADMKDKFARKVAKDRIFEVPFDRHLAEDTVLDLDLLGKKTRRQLLKIAAAVASGFGATTNVRR